MYKDCFKILEALLYYDFKKILIEQSTMDYHRKPIQNSNLHIVYFSTNKSDELTKKMMVNLNSTLPKYLK